MRKFLAIALLLLSSISYAKEYREGVILVSPKAGVSAQQLDKVLNKHAAKVKNKLNSINVFEVSVPVKAEEALVRALSNNRQIKFAELDRYIAPTYIANDTYYTPAWHLHKLNVPASWDLSEGAGITIAIADSGVRVSHVDLKDNISTIPGYNFYDNNSDITDVHGHGTAVASTAAGVTNNGLGVSAIAGKAKILPIRISDPAGYGLYSAMANAITYAANNGARVLNCSYGGGANSSVIQSAANYMVSKGGVVVWSAGNDNADLGFYDNPNILLISATDQNDVRTSWSSFGPYVDLAAPGTGIYVARYTSDTSYGTAAGTSFSAPITAGIVAQMLSVNPKLGFKDVESILKSTAVDLGDPGEDIYYGAGRVDAYAAVLKAKNTVAVDTVSPVVTFNNVSAGKVLTGSPLISVSATDNVAVKEVGLYLTNTLVDYEVQPPYDFIVDTTKFTNGSYTLAAKAVDMAGNSATTSINVYISNGDLTPPIVKFISPTDGAVIPSGGKPVRVTTSASDNTGTPVTQKLYIDNVLRFTGTTISYNWKPTPGTHALRVDATDTGLNKSSVSITVTKK